MHYKVKPEGDEKSYDFLAKKFKMINPPHRKNNRGVSQIKKRDIVSKLCPLMPIIRRGFWEMLPVSEVSDLIDSEQE